MWEALTFEERAHLIARRRAACAEPIRRSDPGHPALIEDGRNHLVLSAPIALACPVRLLDGQADPDVPWELALRIAARIAIADVQVTLVKDGDHRLSRPRDLSLLCRTVGALLRAGWGRGSEGGVGGRMAR